MASNEPAHLAAAFGLLAAGACLVPVASHLRPAELDQILNSIELNGCFSSPHCAVPGLITGAAATLSGGECDGFGFEWIDRAPTGPAGFLDLESRLHPIHLGDHGDQQGRHLVSSRDAARVKAADDVLPSPEDRIVWVLPLAYHFAVTIVAYVRAGAHVLLCSDTLPGSIVDAIGRLARPCSTRHRRTSSASPVSARGPAPQPAGRAVDERADPGRVIGRFEAACGLPVGQAYGIIEAGLPCINPGTHGLDGDIGRAGGARATR